ncbi:hypothetical protein ACFQY7_22815 [Actinomadura luteofluorescens]|uniref:hypothetical protein n=1 Tax=Actinomadura luteofluorescens TaxID=46163 RepID=UPI003637A424
MSERVPAAPAAFLIRDVNLIDGHGGPGRPGLAVVVDRRGSRGSARRSPRRRSRRTRSSTAPAAACCPD